MCKEEQLPTVKMLSQLAPPPANYRYAEYRYGSQEKRERILRSEMVVYSWQCRKALKFRDPVAKSRAPGARLLGSFG